MNYVLCNIEKTIFLGMGIYVLFSIELSQLKIHEIGILSWSILRVNF